MECYFFLAFGFDFFRIVKRSIFSSNLILLSGTIWLGITGESIVFYLFIPFAFAKPDFTFPNTKLRQIVENWEAMMTQEEIVRDMQELKGDIRELKGEIGELKEEIRELENKQQQLIPTGSSLAVQISNKTALMIAKQNSITAKRNRLTALINSQHGNFLFT